MVDALDEIRARFGEAVNMSPKELEDWLESDRSKAAGDKDGGGESTGHRSSRRIVEISWTNKDDLTLGRCTRVAAHVGHDLAPLAHELGT